MKKNSKNETLQGKRLNYNAMQQLRYKRAIEALIAPMAKSVKRQVATLFKSPVAKTFYAAATMDATIAAQAKILMKALMKRFDALFDSAAPRLAESMVSNADKTSAANVSASIKAMTENVTLNFKSVSAPLRQIMKAAVNENVALIKSIGAEYLGNVEKAVYRSITTGQGVAELIPQLEKYEGITYRKAKNIALDQTRKTYSVINKSRMKSAGLRKFKWSHSGGGLHPRESHQKIDGEIFSFNDLEAEQAALGVPPEDLGFPGVPINCGCTAIPVIDFSDEDEDK
jgi:SPP1 gp7 family putative phage head morphogenesis protein